MRDTISICGRQDKGYKCCEVPHKAGHQVSGHPHFHMCVDRMYGASDEGCKELSHRLLAYQCLLPLHSSMAQS